MCLDLHVLSFVSVCFVQCTVITVAITAVKPYYTNSTYLQERHESTLIEYSSLK